MRAWGMYLSWLWYTWLAHSCLSDSMLHTLIPGQEFRFWLPRAAERDVCVMCAYAPQIRLIFPHITTALCPLPPYNVLFTCMGISNFTRFKSSIIFFHIPVHSLPYISLRASICLAFISCILDYIYSFYYILLFPWLCFYKTSQRSSFKGSLFAFWLEFTLAPTLPPPLPP